MGSFFDSLMILSFVSCLEDALRLNCTLCFAIIFKRKEPEKEYIYMCMCTCLNGWMNKLNGFAVHQKLAQHCKSNTLQ